MRLGAVVNAGAGTVKRRPELVAELRQVIGSEDVHLTRSADEVAPALAALREREIDTLLVAGGDGTVTGTLTPLLRSWPADALPRVALTRGGTVNTIARSVGSAGPPARVVAKLQSGTDYRVRPRAVVEVSTYAGTPHYGMIFVNGAGVNWLRMYHEDSHRGIRGAVSVTARVSGSALVGGKTARRTFAPFRAELVVDGEPLPPHDFTVMAAASIREVGLGFAPFHTAGSDPRRIHFAVTDASAARFVLELPAILAGRRRRGSALRHFSLAEAEILLRDAQAWSLDAESFPPAREMRVRAGPTLDFVSVPRIG